MDDRPEQGIEYPAPGSMSVRELLDHDSMKGARLATPVQPAPASPSVRSAEPIKVGALLWSILKDKLARLFRRWSAWR